ncbi:hypothetical protein NIES4072_69590 [Nostoc commune NIES-4072]|uniref:Uncharacterized protein n=1 Tax=Nostoc commune NIES-4072 TaxID=2005467 RepID=A0A2R5FWY0_NOSCO|nr:hypothetical protein NIES4070_70030 [Nostoc commune HK-02]GBG23247.1 hypothetical protein NIES4072_69590 [Nostoc commune NIES-4072]
MRIADLSPKRAGEAGEEEKQGGRKYLSCSEGVSVAPKFIYEKEKIFFTRHIVRGKKRPYLKPLTLVVGFAPPAPQPPLLKNCFLGSPMD